MPPSLLLKERKESFLSRWERMSVDRALPSLLLPASSAVRQQPQSNEGALALIPIGDRSTQQGQEKDRGT